MVLLRLLLLLAVIGCLPKAAVSQGVNDKLRSKNHLAIPWPSDQASQLGHDEEVVRADGQTARNIAEANRKKFASSWSSYVVNAVNALNV